MANRFEQVDEPVEDAVTLKLEDAQARVLCPAALAGGRMVNDYDSGPLEPVEAFRTAIGLANEIKAPVVVIDAEGGWHPEWGALYREN